MAAARSPSGGFKTRGMHFKVKTTLLKEKKWKEKVQKNAQFSFCREREAFYQEIVLRGIRPCFLHGQRMVCFEMQPRQQSFGEFSGTFCTLWPRKLRF